MLNSILKKNFQFLKKIILFPKKNFCILKKELFLYFNCLVEIRIKLDCSFVKKNMRPILFYFLLFSCTFFGQTWKDQNVEQLILDNKFEACKTYLVTKLNNETNTTTDQLAYYNAKLSHCYLRTGQFNKALHCAKTSKTLAIKNNDPLLQSETWRAMAFAYIRTAELDSALVYAEKMYVFGKENTNYDFTRAALMCMGNIAKQQLKHQEATIFYADALKLTKKNPLGSKNLKVDYYNLAEAYTGLKKMEEAVLYFELALKMALLDSDEVLLARIYGGLSYGYSKLKNNRKSIIYQDKSNQIAIKNNNFQLLAMGYSNMMQWSLNENNPTKAIEYGNKSIEYLKKFPNKQLEIRVDSIMYAALKTIKRDQEALSFLESYTQKKKKVNTLTAEKRLEELLVKYDVENKNLKIKNQEIELAVAKRERNIYLLITGIIVLFILGLLLFKMNQRIYKNLLYRKEKNYDNLYQQIKSVLQEQNKQQKLTEPSENSVEIKSESLYIKLIDTIENEKLFLNPELDQKTLIRLLGTNKKYLYEAIKIHGETNFRGIINRLRINHAKNHIENQITNKNPIDFSQLYLIVGFNANSTFYRTFKTMTGITPNEYAIEFKKDLK